MIIIIILVKYRENSPNEAGGQLGLGRPSAPHSTSPENMKTENLH
jgi:hypothetical protein